MSLNMILEPDGMFSQDYVECFMFDYERLGRNEVIVNEEGFSLLNGLAQRYLVNSQFFP